MLRLGCGTVLTMKVVWRKDKKNDVNSAAQRLTIVEVGVIRQQAEAVMVFEMLGIMNVPLITLIGHVLNVFPHSGDYSNACFCFQV